MIQPLLNKSDLSILNKRTLKYHLADAEKDYFIALVLELLNNSKIKKKLVFKGGTAIHHCYLPQSRFSEDIDFTSLDPAINLDEVKSTLTADFLEIKDVYTSKSTIKINRLKYTGPLGLPNSLKVEIDFQQNVVLPAKKLAYNNAWKINTSVWTMDKREICAEKIRAASDRSRYRDFYDLYLLSEKFSFDMNEIISLVKQKEIRKSISKKSMLDNLRNALVEKQKEFASVYYAYDIHEKSLVKMINDIPLTREIKPNVVLKESPKS